MHIHSASVSAAGNSLAGAALAAETALATRRAQQLRDAGRKLKAASLEADLPFGDQFQSGLQSASPSLDPAVQAIAGGYSGSNASAQASVEGFAQRFANDAQLQQLPAQIQEVRATPAAAPVSYWA